MHQLALALAKQFRAPVEVLPSTGDVYRGAIRQVAFDMLEGEDVDARISRLAAHYSIDEASLRQEVAEMVDLLSN